MALVNNSQYMSLPIPTPSQQVGPAYAGNLNASLTIIDGHDHSVGSGVQITPSGININSDFPFNNNNAITLKSARFTAQPSFPASGANLLCIYAIGNDLYYNDGAGNQIRITQSGSVSGASGTITGLPSGTASAAYSAGPGKFILQSASNIGADLDIASVIIREKVTSGHGVTISAPSSLAADYTLTLPAAIPASTSFVTIDNAGNVAASVSTNAGVTRSMQAAVGQQISSSSGTPAPLTNTKVDMTNMTVTITTNGRPVIISLQPDGSANNMLFGIQKGSTGTIANATIFLNRAGSDVAQLGIAVTGAAGVSAISYNAGIQIMDVPAAGTYIYKFRAQTDAATNVLLYQYAVMAAYQL